MNMLRRKHIALDCYDYVICIEHAEERLFMSVFWLAFQSGMLTFSGRTCIGILPYHARNDYQSKGAVWFSHNCIFMKIMIIAWWTISYHHNRTILIGSGNGRQLNLFDVCIIRRDRI
jgi:hypothetical protein